MIKALDRLDPASLTPEEKETLERLYDSLQGKERPALVSSDGVRMEIPEPVFHLLINVVRAMEVGQSIVMMRENEAMTTQAAADMLGVSRPFLVSLLEKGEIPFHTVGAHRRVLFNHLVEYEEKRDKQRHQAIVDLSKSVDEAGFYDSDYTGDE